MDPATDVCRVQVSIPYASGAPTDVITNTWHFQSIDLEPIDNTHVGALFTVLQTMYNAIYSNSANKAMASYVAPANTVMKAYDLGDPKPRTAVRESTVPLTVGTQITGVTPPEAAIVLSYRGDYESGTAKASQRGRVYLGGLADAWISASNASVPPTVKPAALTSTIAAVQTMRTQAFAADWLWVVYSEKLNQITTVQGGWMDNAIDTQRRRGQQATLRTLYTT